MYESLYFCVWLCLFYCIIKHFRVRVRLYVHSNELLMCLLEFEMFAYLKRNSGNKIVKAPGIHKVFV